MINIFFFKYFRDMSLKPNEKHDIENALSEDKILEILKNVQSGPVTYSKVIISYLLIIYFLIIIELF